MHRRCVEDNVCSTPSRQFVAALTGLQSQEDFTIDSVEFSTRSHVHWINTQEQREKERKVQAAPIMCFRATDLPFQVWGMAATRTDGTTVPSRKVDVATTRAEGEGIGEMNSTASSISWSDALSLTPRGIEQRQTIKPKERIEGSKLQLFIRPPDVRPSRHLLGRGYQGVVWLNEDAHCAGLHYAVKTIEVPASMPMPVHRLIAELRCPSPEKISASPIASPWGMARKAAFEREACLWQQLCCHHGVVQLHGVDAIEDEKSTIYRFFMEYMLCGSLSSFVYKCYSGGRLREESLRWFLKPILECVSYMHERHIVHLDIKAENLFVTWDKEHAHSEAYPGTLHTPPVTKLGDFGCAQDLHAAVFRGGEGGKGHKRGSSRGGVSKRQEGGVPYGTPGFIAPEVIRYFHDAGDTYGTPADVWSFGCTILQLLRGSPPVSPGASVASILFETALHPERIQRFVPPTVRQSNACDVRKATSNNVSIGEVEEITISASLRDLLMQCLQADPRERPTAAHLLQHPFFQQECCPDDAAVGSIDSRAIFRSGVVGTDVKNTSFAATLLGSTVSTLLDGISSSEEDDSGYDAFLPVVY